VVVVVVVQTWVSESDSAREHAAAIAR